MHANILFNSVLLLAAQLILSFFAFSVLAVFELNATIIILV